MEKVITYDSPQKFADLQRGLLENEREAEIERTKDLLNSSESANFSFKRASLLEKKGLGLKKLRVQDWCSSIFGKNLVSLGKHDVSQSELPASCITNGDIVGLFNETSTSQEEAVTGVVTCITSKLVTVSIDDSFENIDQEAVYFVVKLANDVTYKRLKSALDCIADGKNFSILHNFLFGQSDLSIPHQSLSPSILTEDRVINFINQNLNDYQKEAIEFALKQKELAVIHGPPGTGKTTTVVELISQEVKQGHKVLCCAPSNVAVDNLLEKLAKNKIKVVRIGHPARVAEDLQKYALDAILANADQKLLAQDVKSDLDKALAKLKKPKVPRGERQSLKMEMKQLRKELKQRESRALKETLSKAEVVLTTLTSCSNIDGPLKHLDSVSHFDVGVIDECSQALEMACWLALLQVKKVVLAGDHLQLPPTIMSESAAAKGLAFTLMERVIKASPDVLRMLNIQYRMNESIMNWSSETFYESKLIAHDSVKSRLLKDLPKVSCNENTEIPLVLIDTSGCDMHEIVTDDEQSKANEGEAALVTIYANQLIESGISPSEIAVISPYNLQVELIRLQLREKYPDLEIRSVDGFQGREKEVVILSLVRSNPSGQVGFLAEPRRLNVAITRAKRHVAIIANVDTVSKDPVLKGLIEYLEVKAEVRSAMQYEDLLRETDVKRPEGLEFTLKDSIEVPAKTNSETKKKKPEKKSKSPSKKKAAPEMQKNDSNPEGKIASKCDAENDQDVAEKENKELVLQRIIDDFVENESASTFHCSANLNSHDRMLLHEMAEKAHIGHASQGDGKNRHIVLTKKAHSEINPFSEERREIKAANSVICSTCRKEIPRANIELHKLKCAPLSEEKLRATVLKKKRSSKKDSEAPDDLDKLLASFDKVDNVCNAEKCKIKIATLGVQCEHCRRRFCIGHGLPESHGCGDAARKAARQQLSKDGKLFPGSGRPNFKPDPAKKAALQRRLDKKLEEMQESRSKKSASKK